MDAFKRRIVDVFALILYLERVFVLSLTPKQLARNFVDNGYLRVLISPYTPTDNVLNKIKEELNNLEINEKNYYIYELPAPYSTLSKDSGREKCYVFRYCSGE